MPSLQASDKGSVFVTYTKVDAKWADWLSWHLEAAGYQVKVRLGLPPGRDFVAWLNDEAARAQRVLVVLSNAYLVDETTNTQWQLGPRDQDRVVPVHVEPCEPISQLANLVPIDLIGLDRPAATKRLLEDMAAVEAGPRRRRSEVEPPFPGGGTATTELARPHGPTGSVAVTPADRTAAAAAPPSIPENPYRGLNTFGPADQELFVGRKDEVDKLVEEVEASRLVVVVGPSGVGKSSLIRAGLIPALVQNHRDRSSDWMPVVLPKRTNNLINDLALELQRAAHPDYLGMLMAAHDKDDKRPSVDSAAVRDLAANLRARPYEVESELNLLAGARNHRLLIVLDQFEEILNPTFEEAGRFQFLEVLRHAAATSASAQFTLVVTMRSDFIPAMAERPDSKWFLDRLSFVPPMDEARRREVVEKPARTRDVSFSRGLARRIARDAAGAGGLALLEFALTELWPTQRDRRITEDEYEQIGAVSGALGRHADRVVARLIRKGTDEAVLRRALLSLVTAAGVEPNRVVVRSPAIRPAGATQSDPEWEVLRSLAAHNARLVTMSQDGRDGPIRAELAHEVLITAWPLLAETVKNEASFLDWHRRMAERDPDDLLTGALLAEAEKWTGNPPGAIDPRVADLVRRSRAAQARREAEANTARRQAEENARRERALRLATTTEIQRLRGPGLLGALAYGIASLREKPTYLGDFNLRRVLKTVGRPVMRSDDVGPVTVAAFGADGWRVVLGGRRGATVWDAVPGHLPVRFDEGGPISSVSISPDGRRLATASRHGASLWSASGQGFQYRQLDPRPTVLVRFSPDGSRLVLGGEKYGVQIRSLADGSAQLTRPYGDVITDAAFSPDGARLAVASQATGTHLRNLVDVLDVATGEELVTLKLDDLTVPVTSVAFSRSGNVIVTGTLSDGAALWNPADGKRIRQFDAVGAPVAVAVTADGGAVAVADGDGQVYVWDATTGGQRGYVKHHEAVRSVEFSADGSLILLGSDDGTATVRTVQVGGSSVNTRTGAVSAEVARLSHDGKVVAAAFTNDATKVVTVSSTGAEGRVSVWHATAGAESAVGSDGGDIAWFAFNTDGSQITTISHDGIVRVLSTAEDGAAIFARPLAPRRIAQGRANAIDVSLDQSVVAVAERRAVTLVNLRTGFRHSLAGAAANSADVAFLSTGRHLATCAEATVTVWEVADDRQPVEVRRISCAATAEDIVASPDGSAIAVAVDNDSVEVWAPLDGTSLGVLRQGGGAKSLTFSPDGQLLVTTVNPGVLRLWKRIDGSFRAHGNPVDVGSRINGISFSADGCMLAAACDGAAHVWQLDNAARLTTPMRLPHERTLAVSFSHDGTRIATGGADHTARIWTLRVEAAGQDAELSRLEHDPDEVVQRVAFSPDDTQLATVTSGRNVKVWPATCELLVDQATRRSFEPIPQIDISH